MLGCEDRRSAVGSWTSFGRTGLATVRMAEISIFISYRRDDDAPRAVMLDRIISGTFNEPARPPRVRIYRDTAERLGVQRPQEVRNRCSSADMVLVVIGPK